MPVVWLWHAVARRPVSARKACSNGSAVELGGVDVFLFEEMFWNDSHSPGGQTRGEGLFVGDSKSIRIQYLGGLYQFIVASSDCIGFLIHNFIISEFHIFGSELLAVVPENTFPQIEGDDRFRAILDLPGFC